MQRSKCRFIVNRISAIRVKKVVVLYHANCPDGFSAAWVAWRIFGTRAEYIPVRHQEPPPPSLKGKDVYCLDFSYRISVVEQLLKIVKTLTIIDHHKSAERAVKKASLHLYSGKNSASVLTWNYFYPKKEIPRLLRHVEDIDLWKFHLPHTKEIMAIVELTPYTFTLWNKLAQDIERPKRRIIYIERGKTVLAHQKHLVDNIAAGAYPVLFCGHRVLAVNSPILHSEIGNVLAERKPPFAIVWSSGRTKMRFSLRSLGHFDVAKIAERFGGGGHRNAAGFFIPRQSKLPFVYAT